MCGGCPRCLYLSISGGLVCVEALGSFLVSTFCPFRSYDTPLVSTFCRFLTYENGRRVCFRVVVYFVPFARCLCMYGKAAPPSLFAQIRPKYGQNTAKRCEIRPFFFVLSLILNTIRNGQNTAKTKRRAACLFSVRFFDFGRVLLLPYGGRG